MINIILLFMLEWLLIIMVMFVFPVIVILIMALVIKKRNGEKQELMMKMIPKDPKPDEDEKEGREIVTE